MGKIKEFMHLLGKLLRLKVFTNEKPQSEIADIFDTASIEIAQENLKPKFIFRPRCPYRKPIKKAKSDRHHRPKKGERISWRYATMHKSAFADACRNFAVHTANTVSSVAGSVRAGFVGALSAVRGFCKFISLRARTMCSRVIHGVAAIISRTAIFVKSTAVKLCSHIRVAACIVRSAVHRNIVAVSLRARNLLVRKERANAESAASVDTAETTKTTEAFEIPVITVVNKTAGTPAKNEAPIETDTDNKPGKYCTAFNTIREKMHGAVSAMRRFAVCVARKTVALANRTAIFIKSAAVKLCGYIRICGSAVVCAACRFGEFISLRARAVCARVHENKSFASAIAFIREKSRNAFNAVKSAFGKAYAAIYPIYRKVRHFIRKNVRNIRLSIGSRIIAEISVRRARKVIARKIAEATDSASEQTATEENKKFSLGDSFRALFADKRMTAVVELGIVSIILTSAFLTFAWFANAKSVGAAGMSVYIEGTPNLVISDVADNVTDCSINDVKSFLKKTFTADSAVQLEPAMHDTSTNKLVVVSNTEKITALTGKANATDTLEYTDAQKDVNYIDFVTYIGLCYPTATSAKYTDLKLALDPDDCYAECGSDEKVKSGVKYYSYSTATKAFTEETLTVGESAAGYFTHVFDGVYLTTSIDVLYGDDDTYIATLQPFTSTGASEAVLSASGVLTVSSPVKVTIRVYFDGSMVADGDESGKTILRAGNQRINRIFLGFDYTIDFETE